MDDATEQLVALLDQIAQDGAQSVTASYLFLAPIGSKRRFSQVPYLGSAVGHCSELCPIEGGTVYTESKGTYLPA